MRISSLFVQNTSKKYSLSVLASTLGSQLLGTPSVVDGLARLIGFWCVFRYLFMFSVFTVASFIIGHSFDLADTTRRGSCQGALRGYTRYAFVYDWHKGE
jgi:thiosulfate reductase cytochrome b subunit